MPKKKKIDSSGVKIEDAHVQLCDLGGLLKVTTVIPSFQKRDKELSDYIAKNYQGKADWFKVAKSLIDPKLIQNFRNRTRTFYHDIEKYSFPYDNPSEKGRHLFVLNQHFGRVNLEYQSYKKDFDDMVASFSENFDNHIADAQIGLGGIFDPKLYPDPSIDDFADRRLTKKEIDLAVAHHKGWKVYVGKDGKYWKQGLFHARDNWSAVPTLETELDDSVFDENFQDKDSYRVQTSQWKSPSQSQLYAKIAETQRRKDSEFRKNTVSSILDKFTDGLDEVVKACQNYNPKDKKSAPFRNTKLAKLKTIVEVAEDYNKNLFGDSPSFDKALEKAKQILNGVTVENLRDDDSVRKDTAEKLSDVKDEITDNAIENFQDLIG